MPVIVGALLFELAGLAAGVALESLLEFPEEQPAALSANIATVSSDAKCARADRKYFCVMHCIALDLMYAAKNTAQKLHGQEQLQSRRNSPAIQMSFTSIVKTPD